MSSKRSRRHYLLTQRKGEVSIVSNLVIKDLVYSDGHLSQMTMHKALAIVHRVATVSHISAMLVFPFVLLVKSSFSPNRPLTIGAFSFVV